MRSSIALTFEKCKKENRPVLLTYTVAGDNTQNNSLKILNKISKHADILELGFPHNTPIADGGQIQGSSYRALENGLKLKDVFLIVKKFRRKNPGYIKGNGCVYVGQSSRKPELRFEQHKEGYKSNNYAKVYGIRLRPDLYEKYNPIPSRKDAEEIEEMLGKELRKKGVGVWYN